GRAGGLRMKRQEAAGQDATAEHVKDFIDSVRSRKKPAADAEVGHRSSVVPHLGNIAYRTGRKLRWDAAKEEVVGDPEASALLARKARKPWDPNGAGGPTPAGRKTPCRRPPGGGAPSRNPARG